MTDDLTFALTTVAASGLLDARWYLATYPDVAAAGVDPLTHWVRTGHAEGRDPGPDFDAGWYRATNPDVAAAGVDPLVHYLTQGWVEGRAPRADFDPVAYEARHPYLRPRGICPLVHARAAAVALTAQESVPEFVADPATTPPTATPVRTVAFYLPQFHPIPENDEWWGRGFTEWTNVVRGLPRFEGHHQPHLPGELGFYDLRVPEVMRRQVELARLHGVTAFCFYAYWFNGRRVLERPLEAFLADPSLDLEFTVCWANEPWTRTWDGSDREVLLGQEHSAQDDLDFIADAARYLRDPRCVRIDGRPLLLVYRPSLLPDAAATARRWRTWCRENGVGEIVLAYAQSFSAGDPRAFGFDRALEFPPNAMGPRPATVAVTDPAFTGTVLDWTDLADRSEHYDDPGYPLWRGVCPSWDNEARRPGRGTTLVGATPSRFSRWLENAGADVCRRFAEDDRLVFVNAWNEWAEGAHLEPDTRHGYAWLHAVRQAQERLAERLARGGADDVVAPRRAAPRAVHALPAVPGVAVVVHDLHPHGAQMLSLAMVTRLAALGVPVCTVALGPGRLREQFLAVAPLHEPGADADGLTRSLADQGVGTVWCNSSASGGFAAAARRAGLHVTSLVHELPGVLAAPAIDAGARTLAEHAHRVVFPATSVRDAFPHTVRGERVVRPQGLYGRVPGPVPAADVADLRRRLAVPEGHRVVLGVGYGDHRKGVDLFAAAAASAHREGLAATFVWVGALATDDARVAAAVAAPSPALRLVPFQDDVTPYYAAADVLLLPSREDPFPTVTLEALVQGVPVVAVRGCTGQDGLVERSGGVLVASAEPATLARAVVEVDLGDGPARAARRDLVLTEHDFGRYVLDLLAGTPSAVPRVSVVVPNYRYAGLLADRIAQVAGQTYPLYELVVLDDASPDDSVEVARTALAGVATPSRLVVNEQNSGSVFRQWARGVALCTGDLVWIAEADDVADPRLVEELVRTAVAAPGTVLATCMSSQLGPDGELLAPDYADYLANVPGRDWSQPFTADGVEEVARSFAVMNTVLNVSGALLDRRAVQAVLDEHLEEVAALPSAGDWLVYVRLLQRGGFAWTPTVLNGHRRHPGSVVARNLGERHWAEIAAVQDVVRSLVVVGEDVEEATRAYRVRVLEHLGLDPALAGAPSPAVPAQPSPALTGASR